MLGRRKRKSAFQQSDFWDNIGIAVFAAVALYAVWYVMTTVLKW